MVTVRDLKKSYPGAGASVDVLRGVNFDLATGESAALVGPSGCGKSTLLNILGGLDTADSGSVRVGDTELVGLNDAGFTELRRSTVGFIFQFFHLLPTLTVRENVQLPQLVAGEKKDSDSRTDELLELVGLAHRSTHRPHELSGGEMQRAAIARSLINRPRLLLADEPTGNLDSANGEKIMKLLLDAGDSEKVTIILVTHSPEIAAMMGRTLRMSDGQIAT